MTFNFQLSPHSKEDGTHNIRMRIYSPATKKSTYLATQVSTKKKNWNQKKQMLRGDTSRIIAANNFLKNFRERAEAIYFEEPTISLQELKNRITGKQRKHVKPTIEQILPDFISAYENRATKKSRRSMILQFARYAPNTPIDAIDYNWLEGAVKFFRAEGNRQTTIAGKIDKLTTFLNYCVKKGVLSVNPAIQFKVPPGQPKQAFALSFEEQEKLITVQNLTRVEELARDTFLMQLYCAGLRISDTIKLQKKHIIGDNIVYQGGELNKQKRVKTVFVIEPLKKLIEKYHDPIRPTLLPWLTEVTESTNTDTTVTRINRALKLVGAKAGIKEFHRLSSHVARHTHAVNLLELNINPEKIRNILGHQSLTVTMRYLQGLKGDNNESIQRELYE